MQVRHFARSFVAAAAVAVLSTGAAQAAEYAPGRIVLQTRAGLPDQALQRILAEHGGGKLRRIGRTEMRVVELPAGVSESAVAERLARHPHIEFAELDRRVAPTMVANDPYLGSEWHLATIGATTAWDQAQGAGITIAILDTGVDASHPDLAPRLVPGWNLYDNNSNTADVHGHGTKVAGTAAAAGNNGVGVAGVAAQALIMPLRISLPDGSAYTSTMADAIVWAADHGARVANVSYQCADSSAVISAGNYMKSKGGLVAVAAGNSGVTEATPATSAVIPVGATDGADNVTSWSTSGPFVALSAPGSGIYTTAAGGGYASVSGTSFASPVTAGVIGLMMSARPSLPVAQIESLLYSTALDLGAPGRDPYYGHGRVNAAAAVQAAVAAVSNVDTVAPTVALTSPAAAASVAGLVSVNVAASDNVGVSKVELRINGTLVATDTAAPFAFSWDSTQAANGSATFVATAYDATGNAAASAPVTVTVNNVADTTPPTVSLSNPVAGSRVSGQVAVLAVASDNAGTAGLTQTLKIDGATVASSSGGKLSYRWNTNKIAAGTHTLQVTARDAAGNVSTQTVQVSK